MYKVLMKRYKEVLKRKEAKIKMCWLTPLTSAQIEKMGLEMKKSSKTCLP